MKAFFGFLVIVALVLGGAYLGRAFIVDKLYPDSEILSDEIGIVPHDMAVKEYSVSQPSEMMVRVTFLDGTESLVTVSQSDEDRDWENGISGPLPVQFSISSGRYSTEWFPAQADETFRVALANIASDRFAEEGTLARITVFRREPIPTWMGRLVPEAYDIEGARIQRFDPDKEIDTENIMNFVYEMDD